MKKLMMIIACLVFLASSSFAQNAAGPSASSPKPKAATASAKYYCPKCMAASDKPGTCAHCKVALVKEGDYYCPSCGASSAKPGKCPSCNKTMVRMTGKKA